MRYTMTSRSVVVHIDGKTITTPASAANYQALRQAIFDGDEARVRAALTPAGAVSSWSTGRCVVDAKGNTTIDGVAVPRALGDRIAAMTRNGQNVKPLFRFWQRLLRNPSPRSREQLYGFLQHVGIPLTPDGCFLAYKGVRRDFKDKHTGTIDNSVGCVVTMPRDQVSDDPSTPCHAGLHVGSEAYAKDFGGSDGRVIICKVDPEHVVCVPNDCSQQKMRTCAYRVVGLYGATLPSSVIDECGDEGGEALPRDAAGHVTTPSEQRDSALTSDDTIPVVASKRRAHRFDKLDAIGLLTQSVADLRDYARHLGVIGAAHIHGGRGVLVGVIESARST